MDNKENSFSYSYSAAQQAEVKKIRSKYVEKPESKWEQLRALDRSASKKAKTWALVIGILGALIMGTGMSLVMTELGKLLGVYAMVIGVAVGLVGMLLVLLAYPIYNRVLKKQRDRIAPEILRLTDELLKS